MFSEQDFSALVHRIDEINGWLNPYRGVQPLILMSTQTGIHGETEYGNQYGKDITDSRYIFFGVYLS